MSLVVAGATLRYSTSEKLTRNDSSSSFLSSYHSNSSDALDKIRFEGLTDKSRLEAQVSDNPSTTSRAPCGRQIFRQFLFSF